MNQQSGVTRRYLIRLLSAIGAYAVLLVVALLVIQKLGDTGWRWLIMALPLPAIVAVIIAIWRWVRETDELQAKIQLQAIAIGFAGGSALTFSYGLMQIAGAPDLSWTFVWPVYAACWLIGLALARSRY